MYAFLVSLIILIALLLVLVVLAQNPKGGGLSSQFGGSGATQVMGVKKTGDILEKLTWGFAIAILVLTLTTNFFIEEPTEFIESPNIESAGQSILPNTIQPNEVEGSSSGLEDLGLTEEDSAN
jgi:preprotein translocase subunit SecG